MRNRLISLIMLLFLPKQPTLLQVLKHLYKYGPWDREYGICGHLHRAKPATVAKFQKLATTWPSFSGDKPFPVPHPKPFLRGIFSAEHAFHNLLKWRGQYGNMRYDLIKYCIDKLENNHVEPTTGPHTETQA